VTGPVADALPVWHDEGRRVAPSLDTVGSALVVGRDPEIAAWVALGIARAQAEHRRVAVADLVGEVGPLQALVSADDDPHGISDSFLYGVSLNKIARPADGAGNLFVLPSGSEAVAVDEIFRSDRWRRLAGGFREVGALLLLVAQADTPGLDALAASVDGVVLAGDAAGALPDAGPPLAVVGAPTRRARPSVGRAIGGGAAAGGEPRAEGTAAAPAGGRRGPWVVGGVAALALAAAVLLFVRQRTAGGAGSGERSAAAALDSTRRADSLRAAARPLPPDTLPMVTLDDTVAYADTAMWTTYVGGALSPGQQILDPRIDLATLPPAVVSLVQTTDGPFYRTYVGAYASRALADSLLASLRVRGAIGQQSGETRRTPYALLLADSVRAADAATRVQALATQGVNAYVLSRGNGRVVLYTGAFETREEAALLARDLRRKRIAAKLVYRTGRSL
jgi:hypothetical protein